MNKESLRREMRARRRALSPEARTAHAQAAADHLAQSKEWQDADSVALYIAADGELDPAALFALARTQGKSLYLPTLSGHRSLSFRLWVEGVELTPNRFGIPEPDSSAPPADVGELSLMCLPLVAWDADGTRLGMGGGYYDRSLADKRHNCTLVGLAYSFQEQARLPRDNWDVPLHLVATEHGLVSCQG